jgi:hypothetical protein
MHRRTGCGVKKLLPQPVIVVGEDFVSGTIIECRHGVETLKNIFCLSEQDTAAMVRLQRFPNTFKG